MGRDGVRPTRAGTPAPQCGTGDLARQIAENGLEIGQTPGTDVLVRHTRQIRAVGLLLMHWRFGINDAELIDLQRVRGGRF